MTLLSNVFNDIATFMAPHDVSNAARAATTTWYRMAVISGKGLNFPKPTSNNANDHTDFGTDGGAHNFLRYIEDWSSGSTLNSFPPDLRPIHAFPQVPDPGPRLALRCPGG